MRIGRYIEEGIITPVPQLQEADVRAILMQYEASYQDANKQMGIRDLVGGRLSVDSFNVGVTTQLGNVLTVLGQGDQAVAIGSAISNKGSAIHTRDVGTRNLVWQRNGQL